MPNAGYIWLGIGAFLVIILLFRCIRVVPQANCWVTEFLGKYRASWSSGLHFKVPFLKR